MSFGFEWSDLKWFLLMVAAGVTTALAIEWATGRMRVEATKAAKLEVQNLLLSLANQQNTTTKEPQPRSLDEILMP